MIIKRVQYRTREVHIGELKIGGDLPVMVQSMTISDSLDTESTVEECIRLWNKNCPLIRLAIPSVKAARNLEKIKEELRKRGFEIPLVADVHFTPHAAEIALEFVEKVRINPGNFADKKHFETKSYSEQEYQDELQRVGLKLKPFIQKCKRYNRAVRIGVNQGSLSDRITSYYGDTPKGMVESALEYIAFFRAENFHNLVLSLKSSKPQLMVEANRLFQKEQQKKGWDYPLHLGVTEAGEGEDGRIKSALGIGTLLAEGIGDTIRVSLTEDPENEIPVAAYLARRYAKQQRVSSDKQKPLIKGGASDVFLDLRNKAEFKEQDLGLVAGDKDSQTADGILLMNEQDLVLPDFVKVLSVESGNFIEWKVAELPDQLNLKEDQMILLTAQDQDSIDSMREAIQKIRGLGIQQPIILAKKFDCENDEELTLRASVELGSLLLEGYGDGICIQSDFPLSREREIAFGILQACGRRISKTDFISCPSCGRTQFDLQSTTAKIRERMGHLKGLKIAIMGCIVNGPGEMADADYGYVGSGKGKITLYKNKEIVQRNVQEENAVNALVDLIKVNGDWMEPNS